MTRIVRAGASAGCGERGSGTVGALAGVGIIGLLLMVAANVLLHLHTASVVTAVAFDAARTVATAEPSGGAPGGRSVAVASARALLGGKAAATSFDWSGTTPDTVRLRVTTPGPHLLPEPLLHRLGLATISRTAVVRAERFVP